MTARIIIFTSLFTSVVFLLTAFTACKKSSCFSQALYDQHKNDYCPDGGGGVKGCDGNWYWNECYAHRLGIEVVQ